MQGDGFASKLGGIMEVVVWLCVSLLLGLWCSLGLVPNYVVLVLGNECGDPHHMQGCHTRGLWIGLRKLVVDFEYSSNIQLRLKTFFVSWYLCLAQRLIWMFFFNINHIALCMCNSWKCWFKHPLPSMFKLSTQVTMFNTDSKKAGAVLRKECPLIVESNEENEITATWLVGLMSKRLLSFKVPFWLHFRWRLSVDCINFPMTPHHPHLERLNLSENTWKCNLSYNKALYLLSYAMCMKLMCSQ